MTCVYATKRKLILSSKTDREASAERKIDGLKNREYCYKDVLSLIVIILLLYCNIVIIIDKILRMLCLCTNYCTAIYVKVFGKHLNG